MTNDLERRLAQHLDQVAREVVPAGDLDAIKTGVVRTSQPSVTDPERTPRQRLVAAAAVVVAVGAVGLMMLEAPTDTDDAATTSTPPHQQPATDASNVDSTPVPTTPLRDPQAEDVFVARLVTPPGWEITAEEAGGDFYRAVLRDDRGRSLDAIARWADATDAPSHGPVAGAVADEGIIELGAGSYRLVRSTSDGAVDTGIRPAVVDVLGIGFDDPETFEMAALSLTIQLSTDSGEVPAPSTTIDEALDAPEQRLWDCRWIVRYDDDTGSLAERFAVNVEALTARLGDPTDWLAPGNPIDAPCDSVAGWQGGLISVTEIAPSIEPTPGQSGLLPSARLFGLGASGATVEIGPVVAAGSLIQVEVFEGDGDLAWGGAIAIPECTGGLSFEDPPVTTGRTVTVRMQCAEPVIEVSMDVLAEATWLQTEARVTVANNSEIGGIAGRLTYLLEDAYALGEPFNGGDGAPDGTIVFYRPGFEPAAASLAGLVLANGRNAPIAPLPLDPTGLTQEDPELADTDVLIVIGNDVELDALR